MSTLGEKGLCGICGKGSKLTVEHIPPQCAGNVHGTAQHTLQDWLDAKRDPHKMANPQPRPQGTYWATLCRRCNSDLLGTLYVPSFCRFIAGATDALAQSFLDRYDELKAAEQPAVRITTGPIRPLCIVKVIAGMILALNAETDPEFRIWHDSLVRFVLDPKQPLPAPYRAYLAIHSGPYSTFAPTMLVAPKGQPEHAIAFSAIENQPFAYLLTFNERDPDRRPFLPMGGLHNCAQMQYDAVAKLSIDLCVGFRPTPVPGDYGQGDWNWA